MPTRRVPSYRLHKPSGQAIVGLDKKIYYLGKFGSPESKVEYSRLLNEWTAGRLRDRNPTTIINLIAAFLRHAASYYVKDGRPTGELENLRQAVRPLLATYGDTLVRDFTPPRLETVRELMIAGYIDRQGKPAKPLARTTVNSRIHKVRAMFRWGVAQLMVPGDVYVGLTTLAALKRGRSLARETKPIGPVEDQIVEATLAHLPEVLASMVQFHRRTGCRPSEVCQIRPMDVDRSANPWVYRPESHKTEHHGHRREILIGPRAQQILLPYLLREPHSYCFSPDDSERKRRATMRERRRSKVQKSQIDRSKSPPKRRPRYDKNSYALAIRRACDVADRQAWAVALQQVLGEERFIGMELLALLTEISVNVTELRNSMPSKQLTIIEAAIRRHRAKQSKGTGHLAVPFPNRLVPRWAPNQLRHSAATDIRKEFGLEAAQVILGHSRADVTQMYAERDMQRAASIMKEIG